jgi:hypothetical protein
MIRMEISIQMEATGASGVLHGAKAIHALPVQKNAHIPNASTVIKKGRHSGGCCIR